MRLAKQQHITLLDGDATRTRLARHRVSENIHAQPRDRKPAEHLTLCSGLQ
jgi:hypothetical protein